MIRENIAKIFKPIKIYAKIKQGGKMNKFLDFFKKIAKTFNFQNKKCEQIQFNLSTKTFYAAEVSILENYFPLAAEIHSNMLGVYDNERSFVQYYFDGLTPVAVVLWLDDWQSALSEEDRLAIFAFLDMPATQSAHICAFEVNKFLHNRGYGKAIMKDFVKDKNFVALSAIDGSEKFYKKCGFNIDSVNGYFFYMNEK